MVWTINNTYDWSINLNRPVGGTMFSWTIVWKFPVFDTLIPYHIKSTKASQKKRRLSSWFNQSVSPWVKSQMVQIKGPTQFFHDFVIKKKEEEI